MDMNNFENHIIPKIEAVRNIIKTGQYAEKDRRESLKETFKPITDELEKIDEGIYKLKDELKDLKAIEGPPALPAIEGPQAAAITHDDYMTKKEKESVLKRGHPDISKLINNPDLKEKTQERLSRDSKSLGGQKGSAKGQKKTEIEKQLIANTNFRKSIKRLPAPQTGSSAFYYNNLRDLFDRLHLLTAQSWQEIILQKKEFSEVA